MKPIRQILETVLYVDDLDAAEAFYGGVLGLHRVSRRPGLFVFFRVGSQMLLLFRPEGSLQNDALPAHGARGPGHLCFAVPAAELDAWRAHLEAHGVVIEHEHFHRSPGSGRALYFRDPAGNSIELAPPEIWNLPGP